MIKLERLFSGSRAQHGLVWSLALILVASYIITAAISHPIPAERAETISDTRQLLKRSLVLAESQASSPSGLDLKPQNQVKKAFRTKKGKKTTTTTSTTSTTSTTTTSSTTSTTSSPAEADQDAAETPGGSAAAAGSEEQPDQGEASRNEGSQGESAESAEQQQQQQQDETTSAAPPPPQVRSKSSGRRKGSRQSSTTPPAPPTAALEGLDEPKAPAAGEREPEAGEASAARGSDSEPTSKAKTSDEEAEQQPKEPGSSESSKGSKMSKLAVVRKDSIKTQVTNWGMMIVLPVVALAALGGLLFALRKLWNKYKGREGRGSSAGLGGFADLKNIQILGQQYKEKVQPESEGLAANMEVNEEAGDKDGDKKDEDKLGRLKFKLDYDFNNTNLAVGVLQAEELPGMDMCGTSDPYVKVYLMPDKKKKFETKVHRKTLNPIFNETFNFKVPYAEVTTKTLVFAVYDFDR